jgi:hypothetical protein
VNSRLYSMAVNSPHSRGGLLFWTHGFSVGKGIPHTARPTTIKPATPLSASVGISKPTGISAASPAIWFPFHAGLMPCSELSEHHC